MSITYKQKETTFIGNSDLSGDITIVNDKGELEVNGEDILNFIVDYLKTEYIEKLETTDNEDFIQLILNKK